MKKTPLIITILVIAFMALGFLLYKISPQPQSALNLDYFDLSSAQKVEQPRPVDGQDHVLGNPEAKNMVVAYEDIQCPACRAFKPVLEQLPSALSDTKVVFRHFPLYPKPHQNSLAAAYASEAAAAQGKFWEFTGLMYDRQSDWSDLPDPVDKFAEIAKDAGVGNIDQFKKDILASKYKDKIEKDDLEGVGLGVHGTPTLFFNGHEIQTGDLDAIKKEVEPLYIK